MYSSFADRKGKSFLHFIAHKRNTMFGEDFSEGEARNKKKLFTFLVDAILVLLIYMTISIKPEGQK